MKKSIRHVGSVTVRRELEINEESGRHRQQRWSAFRSHHRVVHATFTSLRRRSGSADRAGEADDPPTGPSSMVRFARTHLYRDTVCTLCEKTVALALGIPLSRFHSRTRCSADAALARQIAMYLRHTTFSLLLTEIGLHFNRDRTTVSYACALIEDRRDDPAFDAMISQLESILSEARNAVALGDAGSDPEHGRRM